MFGCNADRRRHPKNFEFLFSSLWMGSDSKPYRLPRLPLSLLSIRLEKSVNSSQLQIFICFLLKNFVMILKYLVSMFLHCC